MQRIVFGLCTAMALGGSGLARAASEGGAAAQDGVFRGSIAQSVAALIAFALVVVILGKFAWGPIIKALQDRENKIKGDLQSAEAANRKAQQTLADYEKKLADAHAEARKLVEQARGDANSVGQRIKADTEAEIARMRDRAAAEIHQAKQQAVQDLYQKAGELSVAVAGKILQRQITEADTQTLVKQSLAELDRLKVG